MKLQKKNKGKINPKKILGTKAESNLMEKGVVFFEPNKNLNIDSEYLVLPKDITEITNKELGQYLNAFTQQKIYMRTLKGWAENRYKVAKAIYLDSTKDIYSNLSNQKMAEKAKERILITEDSIQKEYTDMLEKQEECQLIQYSIENIEDIIFMLSREVSRRTGDFNEENRNYNVSRR